MWTIEFNHNDGAGWERVRGVGPWSSKEGAATYLATALVFLHVAGEGLPDTRLVPLG